MARSANQKLKLLYLMRYLLRNSDENHPVTVRQMSEYLRGQGISAERKSLYDDIEALQQFGLDIIQVKDGNFYGYYVGSRDFELPELKLLVDSVQSSKFITHKKTRSLIEKIERLGSVHEADHGVHFFGQTLGGLRQHGFLVVARNDEVQDRNIAFSRHYQNLLSFPKRGRFDCAVLRE